MSYDGILPFPIAAGGTDASSFTQSNGIVIYNGTRLVNYAGPQLSSAGIYTNTSQPVFQAYLGTADSNTTGDYTVVRLGATNALTTTINQGSYFNTNGIFTAPVTGFYVFTGVLYFSGLSSSNAYCSSRMIFTGVSAATYEFDNDQLTGSVAPIPQLQNTVYVYMTAGDTASLNYNASGSSKTVGVESGQGVTWFSGYLVC